MSSDVDLLVVRAGDRHCGFLASDVVEVQRLVAWEQLPAAPAAVEGVIDLRGRVVPVLGLQERLDLPRLAPQVTDHLVVTQTPHWVVAVRVTEALGIETVPAEAFTHAADVTPATDRVQGIARLPDSLLVVADLDAFLGWQEADQLERALVDAEGRRDA